MGDNLWLAKVRHYDGGDSVLMSRPTKEQAQAIVDTYNEEYQTDSAYVEEFDPEKFHWPNPDDYMDLINQQAKDVR
jgi:hypothetical protein